MGQRYQATLRRSTADMLEEIRRSLGLEKSDKAGLLDAIAKLASWNVEQASRGHKIVATDARGEVDGVENVDPLLQRLRREARRQEVAHVELNTDEARRLEGLMREPFEPNDQFLASLRRALEQRTAPSIDWGE